MTSNAGRVLNGRYRLVRPVGHGAQASVWVAEHLALSTLVAVKLIDPELAKRPDARERFRREATAAAQLRSSHVVQILDHGIDEDQPFIVMELLEGEDLFERLHQRERLSLREASKIVTEVARALSRAHAAGIVHRDLKPENIFLVHNEDDEIAKVLDFGVAKVNEMQRATQATRVGQLIGTPHYMSPEQVKGLTEVDFRSDLWALGVIVYQCMVGALPFDSEGVGDLLVKVTMGEIPVPSAARPGLSPAFDAWFQKACARAPEERFESARAMAEALAQLAAAAPDDEAPRDRPSMAEARRAVVAPWVDDLDARPSLPTHIGLGDVPAAAASRPGASAAPSQPGMAAAPPAAPSRPVIAVAPPAASSRPAAAAEPSAPAAVAAPPAAASRPGPAAPSATPSRPAAAAPPAAAPSQPSLAATPRAAPSRPAARVAPPPAPSRPSAGAAPPAASPSMPGAAEPWTAADPFADPEELADAEVADDEPAAPEVAPIELVPAEPAAAAEPFAPLAPWAAPSAAPPEPAPSRPEAAAPPVGAALPATPAAAPATPHWTGSGISMSEMPPELDGSRKRRAVRIVAVLFGLVALWIAATAIRTQLGSPAAPGPTAELASPAVAQSPVVATAPAAATSPTAPESPDAGPPPVAAVDPAALHPAVKTEPARAAPSAISSSRPAASRKPPGSSRDDLMFEIPEPAPE